MVRFRRSVHSFVPLCVRSFVRSFVPLFLRSFVPSFLRSFVPSCRRSFVHSFIRSFVHSFIRSFVHSFIRSFVHSVIRSFVHSFIRSFVHSFVPSLSMLLLCCWGSVVMNVKSTACPSQLILCGDKNFRSCTSSLETLLAVSWSLCRRSLADLLVVAGPWTPSPARSS